MECVRHVYMLSRSGVGGVGGDWVRGFGLRFTNRGGTGGNGMRACVLVAVVLVGGFGQGLGECGGVKSVFVVSPDSLC